MKRYKLYIFILVAFWVGVFAGYLLPAPQEAAEIPVWLTLEHRQQTKK